MTNSKFNLILITFLAFGFALISCGNKSNNSTKIEQADKQGKEYTSAYVCPMHCEGSGSHEAGECPVCGMDYVKNESMTHACPMHPEITGTNGDKCSKCGMKLTSMEGEDHSNHNH